MVWLFGLVDWEKEMKLKFAVGAPLVAVKRFAPHVEPPSVDWKMPLPLTAAKTELAVVVSRWRSLMLPARTGAPLVKLGEVPKFVPPSIDLKSPLFVATSRTLADGEVIRLIPREPKTALATFVHVWPASTER